MMKGRPSLQAGALFRVAEGIRARGHPERSDRREPAAQSKDPVDGPKTPAKQALQWAAPEVRTEPHPGDYTVYILTNDRRTVLYIGITNELETRLAQHLSNGTTFTRQYSAHALIYYEHYSDPVQAIAREKQLKGWTRAKKVALIRTLNRDLRDVGRELYPDHFARIESKSLVNPRGPSTARPATPGRSAQDDRGGARS